MSNLFYVYEHWRPDIDICFYVGKGKGKRAYDLKGRNDHHTKVLKKIKNLGMCVEIKLVAFGLSEKEAFEIEKERIAFWRSFNVKLTNKTDGGDGVSGLKMSDDAKAKMSAKKKGLPGRKTMLGKKHSLETKTKMSVAQKGRPKSLEHAAKVGLKHRGKKVIVSDETRAKFSSVFKGRKLSEKAKENMRLGWIIRRQKMLAGEYK